MPWTAAIIRICGKRKTVSQENRHRAPTGMRVLSGFTRVSWSSSVSTGMKGHPLLVARRLIASVVVPMQRSCGCGSGDERVVGHKTKKIFVFDLQEMRIGAVHRHET